MCKLYNPGQKVKLVLVNVHGGTWRYDRSGLGHAVNVQASKVGRVGTIEYTGLYRRLGRYLLMYRHVKQVRSVPVTVHACTGGRVSTSECTGMYSRLGQYQSVNVQVNRTGRVSTS